MSKIGYEISSLTEPISETAVTGVDIREDISPASHYYQYKDIRNEARAAERKALIDDNIVSLCQKKWEPILNDIPKLLINETKDLELCAWYIEALCRVHGFKGLTFGFQLVTELVEKYWDAIYPLPDEDDPYDRIASLGGLNGIEAEGSLIVPIRTIAITNGEEAYSYSDYVQACEHERLSSDEAKKERLDLGATSLEMITKSVKESPENFYPELKSEIEETIAAFKRLSDLFDEIIDGDSLPTSYILKSLQDSLLAIQHIAKDVFEKITQDQARDQMALEHSEDEVEVGGHGQVSTDDNNGPVKNRAMALKKLEELATFFRNTEPHSPMSYGIEQIVFWAGLTLPELLKELIVDDDARMTYFKLSGITTPEDADEASGQMGARGQMDARGGPQGFDQRPVERL